MKMHGNYGFLRQKILIVLVATLGLCAVQLRSGALICGQPAVLNCTVNPFDVITWKKNSVTLVICYTSGSCDITTAGNMTFSVDSLLSTYILTINPVEFSVHQHEVFDCSDPVENKSLVLDIKVPLTSVEVNTKQLEGGVVELSAATNCLKLTENVTFEWTCTSNLSISGTCNVSVVRTVVNTSSCDTGGYCMGAGLQQHVNILTFVNYSGPMDTDDVNLQVTATSIDGTRRTYTSTEIFKLEKALKAPISGPNKIVLTIMLAILATSATAILIILWIFLCKKQNNSRNPDSQLQPTGDDRPNHESSDRSSKFSKENEMPLLPTSPELSEVKETFKATAII